MSTDTSSSPPPGRGNLLNAISGNFRTGFLLLAVIPFAGALLALWIRRDRSESGAVIMAVQCGADIRAQARTGPLTGSNCVLAPDYVQANLVILPEEYALDFRHFCERNPKPCPLLAQTEPGGWEPRKVADRAGVRTDVPRYRVYQSGVLTQDLSTSHSCGEMTSLAFCLAVTLASRQRFSGLGFPCDI